MAKDRFQDEINYGADSDAPVQTFANTAPVAPQPIGSQEAEVVCKVGAQRAAADEALARQLGFSPKPPVFEIGTVVNSVGVDNFQIGRAHV